MGIVFRNEGPGLIKQSVMIFIAAEVGTSLRHAFYAKDREAADEHLRQFLRGIKYHTWKIVRELELSEFGLLYHGSDKYLLDEKYS